MASFLSAFEDLFKSLYELLAAIISTIVNIFQSIISVIIGFFTSIVNLFGDVLGGLVDVAGGVGKFVASKLPILRSKVYHRSWLIYPGNIIILGIVAAGIFVFLRVQQGRPVIPAKKTN